MSERSYIPLRIPAILLHVSDERCADTAWSCGRTPPEKAAPLESQLRHRYLFSIPENAAILDAAAANRLVPVG